MPRMTRFFLFTAVLLAATTLAKTQATSWQFSAESEGSYPSSEIPAAVLHAIQSDESVQDVLRANEPPLKQVPRSWLRATRVRLGGPDETDLVVQGIRRLAGANVTTFWIFRIDGRTAHLLLEVVAHDLEIGPKRRNGYLVAEAISLTVSTVNTTSFATKDGRYVAITTKSDQIR